MIPVADLVLVDTCIWIPFFNRPHSVEKRTLDELLDDDRVALIGPIVAEILLGFHREEQADWVAAELRGIHHLPLSWDDWRAAAQVGRALRAGGHVLPLPDLVIAAVALRNGCRVWSIDPHFDHISELKRFTA